jgi:glycosyltransferase involved in cell wall biosynthesis
MQISIVIPVYNEADSLRSCLDSIAEQTQAPYEVIVVDNNSSDNTVAVAESYNFVTLINESKQGVIHARSTGFDWAKGDIIARIDGDSILPKDWTEKIKDVFKNYEVDAVSGVALYYNVNFAQIFNAIDLFFRRRLSWQLKDRIYLWGANMAIRKNAWNRVKPSLCNKGGMHEDYDVAIHLQELGGKVVFDERLSANVSSRRIEANFVSFMKYVWISPSTYAQHGIKVKRYLYPVVLICAIGYWPGHILQKGYNPQSGRFNIFRLIKPYNSIVRVDPTSNVA